MLYCILFYLSISIALSTEWAFQKRPRPQQLTQYRSLHVDVNEGLAKGPYVAVRAEFEPTTLRSKGIDSTNVPPHIAMFLCYQNAQASSYQSCPQITSLAQSASTSSPVPNLQLPAVLSTHMPSQTLHHPPNPLYPIILLSHPFSASSGSRRRRSRRLLTTAHFNILRGGTLRTEYSKLISNKLEIFFN